jgi:hypothetical protein
MFRRFRAPSLISGAINTQLMSNPLSDRINNLATSQTLAMAALARELKAQGKISSV